MQLNPTEISDLIKSRIEQFEVVSEARTEGTVVSLSDGIARIHGLADVMQGEMPMQSHIAVDAARCKYYQQREFIDTDATETSDPRYRRKMRQMKQALDK